MFGKIVALILALGVVGCALLAVRQARIQAFHELTQARLRIRVMDEEILKLRAEIAARVTPAHVHEMAATLGPLKPMYRSGQPASIKPETGDLVIYDDVGRPVTSGPGGR